MKSSRPPLPAKSVSARQLVSLRNFDPWQPAACRRQCRAQGTARHRRHRWQTAATVEDFAGTDQDTEEYSDTIVTEEDRLCHRVPGFYSFHLEGCEMFFPEDDQERISLTDGVLVKWDDEEDIHRVETQGDMPALWQRYHHAVWMAKYDGDTLNYKDPEYRIERIYLVAKQEDKNDQLDFNQVFRLDHKTQDVRREAVRWNIQDENPLHHIMRIRDDEIIIEDLSNIPSEEDVVADYEDSQVLETLKKLETAQADLTDTSSLADPIDARKDAEVDENSPDDTPASDMI